MTDRIKGVLVTFEGDIREDDAESIISAIRMVKRVHSVEPYVKGAEDYMEYERGRHDTKMKLFEWLEEQR